MTIRSIQRAVATAALFATGTAHAQTAPLIPNPADVAGIGIGTFHTGSPPDGQTVVALNIGETLHREGSTATVTLLGPGPLADASFDSLTTAGRTTAGDVAAVRVGSLDVTRPVDGSAAVAVAAAGAAPTNRHSAALGLASGGATASAAAAGRVVSVPGWSGVAGLPNLPLSLTPPLRR